MNFSRQQPIPDFDTKTAPVNFRYIRMGKLSTKIVLETEDH